MEENILKYFTGNIEEQNKQIKPVNVENVVTSNFLDNLIVEDTLTSNDGNYFIRYGSYSKIEVFTINSIKNEEKIFDFTNLKFGDSNFTILDLNQDEDGRFYGIGNNGSQSFLILLNNFIQDGKCVMRKYYTYSNIGISSNENINKVIKKNGSADYFFYSATVNKVYHFNIDIMQGNSLKTYTFTEQGATAGVIDLKAYIIDNNFIYMKTVSQLYAGQYVNNIIYKKMVIDISQEPSGNDVLQVIRTKPLGNNHQLTAKIFNYKFYEAYLTQVGSESTLNVNIINLNNGITSFSAVYNGDVDEDIEVNYTGNYVVVCAVNDVLSLYYFADKLVLFSEIENFSGRFDKPQVIKKFNLETIVGLNGDTSLVYSTNIYSIGYSSEPYINKNFFIPQYLNIYADSNDETSIVYSRDAINRYLGGNQLTSTFSVPNNILNNTTINEQIVRGQTNLNITDVTEQIDKNRFENLLLTYMYAITIIDNTNENNIINSIGSNRLSNSIWNTLDCAESSCIKARITYEDLSTEILDLTGTINDNVCTINYTVNGNARKIEYISSDMQTVYATYRCQLTGINTITQTIEIERS